MEDINITNNELNCCLYFSSCKLARVIGKTADDQFSITGLSPSHAFLLYIVNKNDGIHQKNIGEILHMTPSTITRFVDKLQVKGLVSRRMDGKNVFLHSTEKGMLLQADISKAWKSLQEIFSGILTSEESTQFMITLNKVICSLESND